MPILNVKVSAAKSPQLVAQISELLLELTTRILKKGAKATGGKGSDLAGQTRVWLFAEIKAL